MPENYLLKSRDPLYHSELMVSSDMKIHIHSDKSSMTNSVGDLIIADILSAISSRGQCSLALAGGNTPRSVYSYMAEAAGVPWPDVHLFWGDERSVPPDHPDSNFRMVKESLLQHIAIPESNIHRIAAEHEPAHAASAYESELQKYFGGGLPVLDLVLLGMGDDGHTASLFPGTSAVHETNRLVTEVHVPQLNTWRITMTLPLLNLARKVIFMVAGETKADKVRMILGDNLRTDAYPASLIAPEQGDVIWMLDSEAAAFLNIE